MSGEEHLHSELSIYHLDKRRPDLQSIMLTQENQDQTLSTLELSNDILFDGIKNKKKLNKNEYVLEMLSSWRLSGNTPYHQPFETLSNIVSQLDPQLSQVSQSPKVIGLLSPVSLLGISSQISPELYKILTEEITTENAKDMYKKNFGDLPISALSNPNYLMKYYDIDADTLRAVMGIYGSGQNDDEPGFISDQTIVTYLDDKNSFVTYLITRTKGENYDWQVNFIEAIPTKDGKLKYWYNFKAQATGAVSTKISLNGTPILDRLDWLPELNKTYSGIVDSLSDVDRKKFTLKFERAAPSGGGSFNTEATFSIETVLPELFFLKLNKVIRLYKKIGITLEQIETAVDSDNRQKIITLYSRMPELKGTSAEKYLQSRGIYSHHPIEQIRFCEKQSTYQGDYQAMWALATDSRGQLCYLHRTYLDGDRKAPLDVTKKMMSLQEDNYLAHADSVAIRMFPVASTLGIAEGIETALSCKQIYGVNTWSTMNAGHMAKFLAPRGVKHLIIFADNDWSATGEAAAYACATKNLKANNDIERISVRWPDFGDFNDLLQQGCQAREREFVKKQRETA
ncbi:hypothetical protein XBKQ1_780009 [Xenorhabdus bovienii str. kraussei Quebec]|uniref:Uncharacterized protein n=1 Tax=Xenorhabdus bovienii str. kraussei Quebec TaxID=1398203 RepID=A0A077PMB8_XENBV|nr:hypothetical protein XBKQ1_780009 [Xenorhabdus bovienii str. kraussei Quebec]